MFCSLRSAQYKLFLQIVIFIKSPNNVLNTNIKIKKINNSNHFDNIPVKNRSYTVPIRLKRV